MLQFGPSVGLDPLACRIALLFPGLDLKGTDDLWDGFPAGQAGAQESVPCSGRDFLLTLPLYGYTEIHLSSVCGIENVASLWQRSVLKSNSKRIILSLTRLSKCVRCTCPRW